MGRNVTFQPALIFQNHMVLQREKPVPLWGYGENGETVTVQVQNKQARSLIQENKWFVTLPPLETSESETILLTCGNEEIRWDNIAVGEVWIAGGQSNMQFFVRYDEDYDAVMQSGENRNIRFFDYPEVSYPGEMQKKDYAKFGIWRLWDQANREYFSAVGYHFARKLQRDLDVPIGIIGCNWGGTPACAWMAPEYLENNAGKIWLEEYRDATKDLDLDQYNRDFEKDPENFRTDPFADQTTERLLFGMSREEMAALMESPDYSNKKNPGPKDKNRPGGLYTNMLQEVAPCAARGIIWYQGESDDKHPDLYGTVFSSMIQCWRETWQEELPFLFVQLAPFKQWLECYGEVYPVIRSEQEWVSKHVPRTWMACIMDSGMEWDIHPKKKKPVGTRLALLAEGKIYGRDILCESPECIRMERQEGQVTLFFLHAAGGLRAKEPRINALELFCGGAPVRTFEASVKGETMILKSEEILEENLLEVRFASRDYCEVNVFNAAGLPVKPFIQS